MNTISLLTIQPQPDISNITSKMHLIGNLYPVVGFLAVLGFFFMIVCAFRRNKISKKLWRTSICSFLIPVILIPILLFANMYYYIEASRAIQPHVEKIENQTLIVGETYDIEELADFINVTRDMITIANVTDLQGYSTGIEYVLDEESRKITFTEGSGPIRIEVTCRHSDAYILMFETNLTEE